MDLSPPRGTRDFLPQEAALREHVIDVLKTKFKLYGFMPLETPAMEHWEVLSSKFAGGEEILKETYRFKDQGRRDLGLRYDLTVPLCRVFAGTMFAKPFKRYQIASVFRDGPLKKGRYREFVQCDVDTLGVESVAAEAELLALAKETFEALGLDVVIKVNHRLLLNGLLEHTGIEEEKYTGVLLSLDKVDKIGRQGVVSEMVEKRGLSKKKAEKVMDAFEQSEIPKNHSAQKGWRDLKELLSMLEAYGTEAEVSPTLARGLNYYTGCVFEVFLPQGEIKSSLAAGGRYDEMVGKFSGKEKIPAVGISFGLDVIVEALKETGKRSASPHAQVYVFGIGSAQKECISITQNLRRAGVACLLDLQGRGVSKNLEFASKQNITHVIIVGEKEIKEGKYTFREMKSGQEKKLALEALLEELTR